MPPLEALLILTGIAAIALVVGVGFGIVVAPRIGRLLDRPDPNDEETGDRPD